ncbi:MAG TPA: 5'-methylthioadenosine/adenosylhomocysteine nucleosidase [Actinomycetales bacterium]|nr:5'-methylthioadenosine/adenosylhomocysteine nucleosidase [Actinomycetales bacterium]
MNETIEVVAVAAMEEEAAPFLEGGTNAVPVDLPIGKAWHVDFAERDVIVVVTGAGLVNAVIGATHAIQQFNPRYLVSAGSAGGLAEGIYVGDVVVGTAYTYSDADASAFGYKPGQIPGMPEFYEADKKLVSTAMGIRMDGQRVRQGRIVSGNTFVDSRTVDHVRETFPNALAADMESAALAQLAYLHELPFVSVRAISDLCGEDAAEDFEFSLSEVAQRSANVVRHLIQTLPHD